MMPLKRSASASAKADLPLAVGPATMTSCRGSLAEAALLCPTSFSHVSYRHSRRHQQAGPLTEACRASPKISAPASI